MSALDILFYLFGTAFFLFVSVFTYYSFRNAQLMRGALGHQLMAVGGVLFSGSLMIGALDHFLFAGSGMVYAEFAIWIVGLLVLVSGGILRARNVLRIHQASLLWVLKIAPYTRVYLIAITGLVLVSLPLLIISLASPLSTEPGVYGVASLAVWALSFAAMALVERNLHSAALPSRATPEHTTPKETLLRDDLLALRIHTDLTDRLLATALPIIGIKSLQHILGKCAAEHDILKGCRITRSGAIAVEAAADTLVGTTEEDGVLMVIDAFSCILSSFLDLYAAFTSMERAREIVSESYHQTKARYGKGQIFLTLLETLPLGLLKEERLALLSKDELEATVKERTRAMEEALNRARSAAEALQASKASFHSIVERSTDGIVVLDRLGEVRFANPAALSFFEHDLQRISQHLDLAPDAAHQTREVEIIRDSGEHGMAELSVVETEWEGESATLALLRDITDRKQVEEALKESESRLRGILASIADHVFAFDSEGHFTFFQTPRPEDLYALPEEFMGQKPADVLPPHVTELFDQAFERNRQGASADLEYSLELDGEVKWFSAKLSPRYVDGEFAGSVTVVRDVTERKQAAKALRESETKYRSLIEQSEDAIYVLYKDRFDLVNPKFQELFGVTLEEVQSPDFDFRSLLAPQSRPLIAERTRRLEAGEKLSPRYEFTALDREGHEIEVEVSVSYVPYKGGTATQGVLRDITERKEMEEALRRRAEELAALQATVLDITIEHDLPPLLETIVERAAQLLDAQAGGMYLCDPERETVRCVVSYNTSEDYTGIVLEYGEGAAGTVAKTGNPVMIDDYRTWSKRAAAFEEEQPFTAVLSVPMTWQGEVIGVLDVLHDIEARRFTETDRELLSLFANHAAIAVENARLYEETRQRAAQLEALREVGLEITAQLDLDGVLRSIASQAIELLGGVGGGLYLYRPEKDALEFVTAVGRRAVPPGSLLRRDEGLSGKVWERNQPLIVDDYQSWEERAPQYEGLPIGATIGVPVRWSGEFLGVLTTEDETQGTFSSADAELLSLFATQAAIAIRNARLYEETERRATQARLLYEVGRHVSSELEPDVLLSTIVSAVRDAFDYHNVILLLLNEEGDRLVMQSIAGAYVEVFPDNLSLAIGEGMVGHAGATGETQISNDVSTDPHYVRKTEEDTQSELVVPIKSGQRIIGVLDIQEDELDAFDEIDVTTMETLSTQLASAIENAQLFQAERKRSTQLATVSKVAESIASTLYPHEVLHRTVELITQTFGYYHASIMLLDPHTGTLTLEAGAGGFTGSPPEAQQRLKEGMIGWAAYTGEPILARDVHQEPRYIQTYLTDTRSELDVPLKYRDRVIGVLDLQSRELNAFDEHDVMAMEALAGHIAAAIENARLFEETQLRALEQETLREAALTMTTALERDEVVGHILAQLQEVVPYDTASVQLLRDNHLEIVGGRGFPNLEELIGVAFDPERRDNPNREVVRTRAPFIVEDAPAIYEGFRREPHAQAKIRSWLGVPMLVGDQVIGIIALDKQEPGFYDEEHAQLAEAFAAQAAIAIENARLYEEVRRQADELKAAVDQLRELDRLKSQFIQNVSHELRSPLALIRGYAEMLDTGELGSVDPEQKEPIAIIARRSRMLSALVQDITLILEAEASPPEPEPVALDELARAAAEDFQISAAEADLQLETEVATDLPPVRGAKTHLRRVLDNLIENAIKFTPQGKITVRVRQPEEGQILLEVSDTGIGIPPEQQERVFERFYQVDGSTKRRYPGTGLGLALVKEIVETYGGEIRVQSKLGEGSTFSVNLPIFD